MRNRRISTVGSFLGSLQLVMGSIPAYDKCLVLYQCLGRLVICVCCVRSLDKIILKADVECEAFIYLFTSNSSHIAIRNLYTI